jgi:hypothetical protein
LFIATPGQRSTLGLKASSHLQLAPKASSAGDARIDAYLGRQLFEIGGIHPMLPGSVLICGTVEFSDNGYDLLFGKRLVPV